MKGRAVSGQGGRLSEPLTTTLLFRAVECRPFEDPLRNFPFPRKGEQEELPRRGLLPRVLLRLLPLLGLFVLSGIQREGILVGLHRLTL